MKKVIAVSLLVGILVISNLAKSDKEVLENNKKNINENNNLAIMLETEFGSGTYQESSTRTWLNDGYLFNDVLSYCENGTSLEWDAENNNVILKDVTKTDKCYVYFDKGISLANYIKSLYNGAPTQVGDGVLYYHDNTLEYGAEDYSYRYAGNEPDNYVCFGVGSENYYEGQGSCSYKNLYRIIGVFKNEQGKYEAKLIKSEYITEEELRGETDSETPYGDSLYMLTPFYGNDNIFTYNPRVKNTMISSFYWNTKEYLLWNIDDDGNGKYNLWEYENQKATLNEELNNEEKGFLKTIGNDWQSKIANALWHIAGGNYNEILWHNPYDVLQVEANNIPTVGSKKIPNVAFTAYNKIGLMYASDYGFAAKNIDNLWEKLLNGGVNTNYQSDDNRQNNWLFNGIGEWTISRSSDTLNQVNFIGSDGNMYGHGLINIENYSVRPCFYLNSNVMYLSGNGSIERPFKII